MGLRIKLKTYKIGEFIRIILFDTFLETALEGFHLITKHSQKLLQLLTSDLN